MKNILFLLQRDAFSNYNILPNIEVGTLCAFAKS